MSETFFTTQQDVVTLRFFFSDSDKNGDFFIFDKVRNEDIYVERTSNQYIWHKSLKKITGKEKIEMECELTKMPILNYI